LRGEVREWKGLGRDIKVPLVARIQGIIIPGKV
jgi:hypothetical protein